MYREVKQIRYLFIAVVLTLALALFLPLQADAAAADISITASDLKAGDTGTGWSYDGETLTLNPGHSYVVEGTFDGTVIAHGYIYDGDFTGTVIANANIYGGIFSGEVTLKNDTKIEGGTYTDSCTINNYSTGTVTGGTYDSDCKFVNYIDLNGGNTYRTPACKVINNSKMSYCIIDGTLTNNSDGMVTTCEINGDVTNYGTITSSNLNSASNCKVWNYGQMEGCYVYGTAFNNGSGGMKYVRFYGSVTNTGVLNTCYTKNSGTVMNQGTISGGEYSGQVENGGKIESGTFAGTVINQSTGIIKAGVFTGEVSGKSGSVIENGSFQGAVVMEADSQIKNGIFAWNVTNNGKIETGTFQNIVSNHGEIQSGTFEKMVTNTGIIRGGEFHQEVRNSGTIIGGTYTTYIVNVEDGTVTPASGDMDALVKTADKGYLVYGDITLWEHIGLEVGKILIIKEGASLTVPSDLTLTGGIVYNYGTLICSKIDSDIINYSVLSGKDTIYEGKVQNEKIISNGIFKAAVTNKGTIKTGEFQSTVDNQKTITGGTFQKDVVNSGTINGGTFAANLNNSGEIKGGGFDGWITNSGTISGGTYSLWVENTGVISGGTITGFTNNMGLIAGGTITSCTNKGTIRDGKFVGSVLNYQLVAGGDFYQYIGQQGGTIDDAAGEINGIVLVEEGDKTIMTVYGNAVLKTDLKLEENVELIIPEGTTLTVTNGTILDAVKGTVKESGELILEEDAILITARVEQQSKDWSAVISKYNKDTVTGADREILQKAISVSDQLLAEGHLKAETKEILEKVGTGARTLLALLDQADAARQTDAIGKAAGITAANVKAGDKAILQTAKTELEAALDSYGKNYTAEEKQAIQTELGRINGVLKLAEKLAKEEAKGANGQMQSPKTGETGTMIWWILLLGATAVLPMAARSRGTKHQNVR